MALIYLIIVMNMISNKGDKVKGNFLKRSVILNVIGWIINRDFKRKWNTLKVTGLTQNYERHCEYLRWIGVVGWTSKNGENYYGYKNHVKVDSKKKFIDQYSVTDASVHDSMAAESLLTTKDKGQSLHADSAYTGERLEKAIGKSEMTNKVHEKGYRNTPLTEKQKQSNTKKGKVRARVEHVFGFMKQTVRL